MNRGSRGFQRGFRRGNNDRRGGGGFGNSRGRGRGGGFRANYDTGPPQEVVELGYYTHPCQDQLVCKATNEQVPFFNAPLYLQNKQQIGKVDEIFGSIKDYVSVTLLDEVRASSFGAKEKLFIDPAKLLPLQRFLPKPPGTPRGGGRGRFDRGGRGRGRGRGDGFSRGRGRGRSFGGGRSFSGSRSFSPRGGRFGARGGGYKKFND